MMEEYYIYKTMETTTKSTIGLLAHAILSKLLYLVYRNVFLTMLALRWGPGSIVVGTCPVDFYPLSPLLRFFIRFFSE